jgi:hypothetical protein
VRVGVDKALLVDHLHYHLGEHGPNRPRVDLHGLQLLKLVEVDAVDELHHQHSLGGSQVKLRNVYIPEVVLFEEMLAPAHVGSLSSEI